MGFIINPYSFGGITILSTVTTSTTVTANLTAVPYFRCGNKFATGHVIIGLTVKQVIIDLKRTGSPAGTAYVRAYNSSGVQQFEFGSINVSTISTSKTSYTFTNLTGYTMNNGDIIAIAHDAGTRDLSNFIGIHGTSGGTDANVNEVVYNGTFLDDSPADMYMVLYG